MMESQTTGAEVRHSDVAATVLLLAQGMTLYALETPTTGVLTEHTAHQVQVLYMTADLLQAQHFQEMT